MTQSDDDRPIVTIESGRLRGVRADGARQFRGIPYGAPTSGAARFRPPRPVPPWAGIRDASLWGPRTAQAAVNATSLEARDAPFYFRIFGERFPQDSSEDALTLHVYTPDRDEVAGLPVLVWIHGGGFTHGSSVTQRTYAPAFPRDQEVILVAVTHRLGALGYAWLGDIDPDYADSANVGLLDLVAALEWVHRNIAAFGGDAGNVTIFGESGGGLKVACLHGVPRADGLFHRAIIQSAPPGPDMMLEREDATRHSRWLLEGLGVDLAKPLAPQLEELDWRPIAAAQAAVVDPPVGATPTDRQPKGFGFSPFIDGTVVTAHPADALAEGASARKPLVMGISRDEWRSERSADPWYGVLTWEELAENVRKVAGHRAEAVLATYRREAPELDPSQTWARITSHLWMLMPLYAILHRRAATGAGPYWEYLFGWTSPVLPDMSAFHGLETSFVFGAWRAIPIAVDDPRAPALSALMNGAWASFARSGDPNGGALPAWPASTGSTHSTMVFDPPVHLDDDPLGRIYEVWTTDPGN